LPTEPAESQIRSETNTSKGSQGML
jgi:hypothetical protein